MVAAITPSIQSLGLPLAFPLAGDAGRRAPDARGGLRIRTVARALDGMQKEAVVHAGRGAWRLVCDEGPYLNGTDLAPFPLAFYTAGLADSYAGTLLARARLEGVRIDALTITQDNRYTMEGSALQGTMIGGALPVELRIDLETADDHRALAELARAAVPAAPGDALARLTLPSTFAAMLNGAPLPLPGMNASPRPPAPDPATEFDRIRPAAAGAFADGIISKLESADTVFGVEGGAGSSLSAEQKRTLHVRGVLALRADGTRETRIQLFKPLGSQFRFLSGDLPVDGGPGRVPDGLMLLSAGIAFCYLTQLSRYAHIVKQKLDACRLVQETVFRPADPASETCASADPVDTQVFIDSPESAGGVQRMIVMGERTCFLHANLRGSNDARVDVRVNGKPVD